MLLMLIVLVGNIAITVGAVMVMALTVVLCDGDKSGGPCYGLAVSNDAGDAADTDCGGGTCRGRG